MQHREVHESSSRIPTSETLHPGENSSTNINPSQQQQTHQQQPEPSLSRTLGEEPSQQTPSVRPDSKVAAEAGPSFNTNRDIPPQSGSPSNQGKMPQYTSRDVGDPSQIKKNKQSMADLKLRRLTELNNRLREDLERERIPVSQASKSIIAYCNSTRDYMVPSVWGPVPKGEDPYAPQQSGGCCMVM